MRAALSRHRCSIPIVAGFVLLLIAGYFGALVSWLLIIGAVVLMGDGVTAAWVRAGGTGGLSDFRQ